MMTPSIAIQHARIFDGSTIIPDSTVVVQDGAIAAIGDKSAIPAGAQVINATGQTLLPGFIDAHTHIISREALREALIFGVTTELDMFAAYHLVAELKKQQTTSEGKDIADFRSAGTLVTAPGGHGTEYGIAISTITDPDQAQAFVDVRIAEGSDYIKLVYDNGRSYGEELPTLSKATMAAVVEAAHRRGKLVIVHTLTLQEALDAVEIGADGLGHLFTDRFPDATFGRFVAEHHAFVIPTLGVLETAMGKPSGSSLVSDVYLAPYLTPSDIANLQRTFPFKSTRGTYAIAEEAIRQLKSAGVPILGGTDAPNPGTSHGASIHRELELLVQAGLTPLEALASVTSVPVRIFGLTDRGRIAPGLRADLILVQGNPDIDIMATRDIMHIWKCGVAVDRRSYRERLEQEKREAGVRVAPAGSESGLVSDFEDGSTHAAFGYGWDISTDRIRGGTSTAQYTVVPEGSMQGKGSLLITGEITAAIPFAWAGAIFYPGIAPFAPANLSEKKGISFWAKGDGKTYLVMLFSQASLTTPATVSFTAGAEWQHFSFLYAQFGAVDGHDLLGVLFTASPAPGKFAVQIDDVRFI
jgi:imidazolonepropionase-like amidohydrolase